MSPGTPKALFSTTESGFVTLFQRFKRAGVHVDWLLLAVIALALPLIALTPLVSNQLPGTNDAELHLHRLISAALNLRNGFLWPRWSPNLHFGFGYPLGNFYAPGWHAAGSLLVIVGVSPVTVVLLAQTFGILLYPVGGYMFGRQLAGKAGALIGAAVFLYAPFRFYELFEQGNISQLIAMGLMPWALWGIGRCSIRPGRSRVASGGLLLAALIVTHHPTAFAFLPVAALYALLVGITAAPQRFRLIAPLAAFALGVTLSAIYWLPAVSELQYVRVQQATTGIYQVETSFVPLGDLFSANQPMDRAALNPPRPFNAGQVGLLVAAGGLFAGLLPQSRLSRWQRAHLIGGAVVVGGCLYLMTAQSDWLWQLVPPAQAIQFPWRLMGVLTVATIPGAAVLVDLLAAKWQRLAVVVGLLLILIGSLPAMAPIKANVTESATIIPGTSIRYEETSGNLGAVSTYEYTPRWSTERPLYDPCPECYDNWGWFVRVNQPSLPANAQVTSSAGSHRGGTMFQITTPADFRLELHQFYFPGWQIMLDGADQPIQISAPYGLLAINIPAGTHTVEAWYGGTFGQHLGDTLALVGLGICLVLFFSTARSNRNQKRTDTSAPFAPVYSYRRLGLGLSALLLAYTMIIYPLTDLFRANGQPTRPQSAVLRLHKVFSDSGGRPLLALVGADLPRTAEAGQRLTARLYWQALQKLDAGWRVALKIQDSGHTTDWANSDNVVPGGFSTDSWPLDKYVVDSHSSVLSIDAMPYVDDLRVLVYKDSGQRLTSDDATIASIRITGGQCPLPAVSATVHYGSQITLNGYSMNSSGGHVTLDLYWRVDTAIPAEYALFIHTMAGNTLVTNADRAPIDTYPSDLWQTGQCLHNQYAFDTDSSAERLLIGFYNRTTSQRLTAASQSPLENDGLVIPLR